MAIDISVLEAVSHGEAQVVKSPPLITSNKECPAPKIAKAVICVSIVLYDLEYPFTHLVLSRSLCDTLCPSKNQILLLLSY